MFGADTPLVLDGLQMAAVIAIATGGAVWVFLRRRTASESRVDEQPAKGSLEDRVRNLERIATDPATDLAAEIDGLRDRGGAN